MRLLMLFAPLALAACQTPCPPADTGPEHFTYVCLDESVLNVTITRRPDIAHIVQEGFAPLDLPADITGAGFRYSQGGAELRGRGREAYWTRPGAETTLCRIPDPQDEGAPA
ncbi:MAG: MliC family protein [Hyphomonadaceae bacterium]